jgi:hypothetical protein
MRRLDTMRWRDFWNNPHAMDVNARHRSLRDHLVARNVVRFISSPDAAVLDFGSGESTAAEKIADCCGNFILCDAAPNIRARLTSRFAGNAKVTVLSPEEIRVLPQESLNLIVVNGVVQYLSKIELKELLAIFHDLLKVDGIMVIGDVVPRDQSVFADAAALLGFAFKGGFFIAALYGLIRIFFSEYRRMLLKLGLCRYDDAEMLAILGSAGFAAKRRSQNIGHDQRRMTFVASRL